MPVEKISAYDLLVENLAYIVHEQWSHWINYMNGRCKIGGDVVAFDIKEWVRWLDLANIPYNKLYEKTKESDREWAKKYLEQIGIPSTAMGLQIVVTDSSTDSGKGSNHESV